MQTMKLLDEKVTAYSALERGQKLALDLGTLKGLNASLTHPCQQLDPDLIYT